MRSSTSKGPDVSEDLRERIRVRARAEGFDAVGFTVAKAPHAAAENLGAYLKAGHHGDMAWMETTAERRADPEKLWSEAKSVVALGVNYTPAEDPLAALERRERGVVSVYAQGADYHDVLKKKLKRLAHWMSETFDAEVKVFVDTAPVMENRWQPSRASAGRASTRIWCLASSARGCFWVRSSPRLRSKPIRRRAIIADPATPASTSVRREHFRRLISSMRGAAFRISPSSTRAISRASSAKRSGTASMAATTASPCARGTSSR
jgi:hypothetical protein